MDRWRHLRIAVIALTGVVLFGTLGYILIEGWSPLDALYMTVTTITTVGFREVKPLSDAGRVYTILLVLLGVTTAGYALGSLIAVIVEGYLADLIGGRRMKKRIEMLKDHYIIAGFGRVGQQIAREFKKASASFVVLDSNPAVKDRMDAEDVVYIQGDASDEAVLKKARIDKAKGLITAVDSDADNVYVVLTARVLRPDLFIIARANLEGSEDKLKRAGADRVISPYSLGGRRMASMLLKPVVGDFLDTVMHGEKLEYQLEEIKVGKDSPLRNLTIRECNIRERCGATILSIKRKSGRFDTDMTPETIIEEGDELVVIGTREQLEKLEQLI
ncbi:MAG: potassium channel protein [Actinomycetota bacterium]